jgi:replicative DNA helicase
LHPHSEQPPTYGLVFPHDLELERAALGTMLVRPDTVIKFKSAGLDRDDFFRAAHQWVYEAIVTIAERGEVPELVIVGSELKVAGKMDEVGAAYFARLLDGNVGNNDETIKTIAGRLRKFAIAREIVTVADRAQRGAASMGDLDSLFARHFTELDRVRSRVGDSEDVLLDADAMFDEHENYIENEDAARVPFGWESIDMLTGGGIRPGEVAAIMARPGIGKTIALCNVAYAVGKMQPNMLHVMFSLEMPRAQIVNRLQRIIYQLDRLELRAAVRGRTIERERFSAAYGNLLMMDRPGRSVSDMSNILRKLELSRPDATIGLVSVDHFGLIGGDRGMSTYDRVSTQARELKELAKRHNVAVLLALQVNRDSGGDGSKELTLGSARDSGVVEEAMDYMLGLRRPDRAAGLDPYDRSTLAGKLMLKIIKNRHGDLGNEVELTLNPRSLRLYEAAENVVEINSAPISFTDDDQPRGLDQRAA